MVAIKEKSCCCGCNACGDACPTHAISFVRDREGFLYPEVDSGKCSNCGACERVCPMLHSDDLRHNEYSAPKCFAGVHKSLPVRFASTSGGAFSAFANAVYRGKGFVGGAVWRENWQVCQVVSDARSDLTALRKSKYIQSDAQGFYNGVRAAVKSGRQVLVCGTPCQMVALRAFLGRDYDNLFIMDFICRGVQSPFAFEQYLKSIESRFGSKVVAVTAKNKELGWRKLTTKYKFEDGRIYYETHNESKMGELYLSTSALCRPSCYECPFKNLPRYADVTVADCWGKSGILPKELDGDLGTSLILINNSKGEALFNMAKTSLRTIPMQWDDILPGNPMLMRSLDKPKCNRDAFFDELEKNGFDAAYDKYRPTPCKPGLKRGLIKWLRRAYSLAKQMVRHPLSAFHWMKDNGILRILRGEPLILAMYGAVVHNEGNITVAGDDFVIGHCSIKTPLARTVVRVFPGGEIVTSGKTRFSWGADVEVFSGGKLEMGHLSGFNMGATIICGDHIKIGREVVGGRHVTIRDTNGGHFINLIGYKNTQPIEIGDHVWLCEHCTIMPGVKIGSGAIVGAHAVVFDDVPPNTLVMGNPAKVIYDYIEWKF